MNKLTLINGVNTDYVSVNDRGMLYGDGLFETICSRNGRCQFLKEHLQRLQKGAAVLGIDYPGDEVYIADIKTLQAQADSPDHVIKLMLTRGTGERGYRSPVPQQPTRITQLSALPAYADDYSVTGIKARVCQQTVSSNQTLAGIKHLNRLENVLARNEWSDEVQEGLMTDADGFIIEATMSNIFFVKNNHLLTPALDYAGVDGIIRQQLMTLASQLESDCEITQVHINELDQMDEIFVCNSLIGIWPVINIERLVDGQMQQLAFTAGPLTKKLSESLQQQMLSYA